MSNKRAKNQPSSKKGHQIKKNKPAESAVDIEQLPKEQAELLNLGEGGLRKADAEWLSDPRFNASQRQAMMAGLGQVAGNRYLQRVIDHMNKKEVAEPDGETAMRSPPGSIKSMNDSIRNGFHPLGSSPEILQRWGSGEHMELGDITGETIDIGGGVELTFGQVVALAGDEFGSL